jgi:hypothetical protein
MVLWILIFAMLWRRVVLMLWHTSMLLGLRPVGFSSPSRHVIAWWFPLLIYSCKISFLFPSHSAFIKNAVHRDEGVGAGGRQLGSSARDGAR